MQELSVETGCPDFHPWKCFLLRQIHRWIQAYETDHPALKAPMPAGALAKLKQMKCIETLLSRLVNWAFSALEYFIGQPSLFHCLC